MNLVQGSNGAMFDRDDPCNTDRCGDEDGNPVLYCPHCYRDLEDPIELETGLCTSDDCLRHDKEEEVDDYQSPCSYNRTSGLLTLETGETIDIPAIQEALVLTFTSTGDNDLAMHADALALLTGKTLNSNLEWEEVP